MINYKSSEDTPVCRKEKDAIKNQKTRRSLLKVVVYRVIGGSYGAALRITLLIFYKQEAPNGA
jgi:hypothetical protein